MRTRRSLVALAAAALIPVLLSGCVTGDGITSGDFELTAQTAAPVGDVDTIRWALFSEPMSLDPVYAFDYSDNLVLANMCESLLLWNPDLSLSPNLATSWSNPDPLTWQYEIREGVTFHDGSPMTVDDVVASLARNLDPEVGSYWYSVYANVESITATGPHTVTVTTRIPDSQFNAGIAGSAGAISSRASLEAAGADYGNASTGVNCTGPYSFTSWAPGESVTMTRYDGYWDQSRAAHSNTAEFEVLTDPNTRINAMQTGEVDGAWMLPSNAISLLRANEGGDVLFGTDTSVTSLVVNNMDGVLGDLRVRQALMYAIDRPALVKAAEQGFAEPTVALTSPSVWIGASEQTQVDAFTDLNPYPYDLEKAKSLIREAGAEGKPLVFVTSPLQLSFDVVSQAVVSAARDIGLDATIKTISPNAYSGLFSDPEARAGTDLMMTSWYLSVADPLEMFGVLRTGDFSNYGNWSDPAFDAITNRAISELDPIARGELSAQAAKIVNDQLPWLPLYQPPTSLWLSTKITGVAPSINYMYAPWMASLGKRAE